MFEIGLIDYQLLTGIGDILPINGANIFIGIVRDSFFEVGSYKVHIYSQSVPYCNCRSPQPQF